MTMFSILHRIQSHIFNHLCPDFPTWVAEWILSRFLLRCVDFTLTFTVHYVCESSLWSFRKWNLWPNACGKKDVDHFHVWLFKEQESILGNLFIWHRHTVSDKQRSKMAAMYAQNIFFVTCACFLIDRFFHSFNNVKWLKERIRPPHVLSEDRRKCGADLLWNSSMLLPPDVWWRLHHLHHSWQSVRCFPAGKGLSTVAQQLPHTVWFQNKHKHKYKHEHRSCEQKRLTEGMS